ncbi:hypothetical protein Tco_1021244 [Tanacetum coccineum]
MLWVPLPKDVVGASTQRCGGSLNPKLLWEPLPKDVVDASWQIEHVSPHGILENMYRWDYELTLIRVRRSGAQGCKAWRPSCIAWSGGQGWWSGGQDVGVVPKGVAWGKRVIMGRVHGCFWTANIGPGKMVVIYKPCLYPKMLWEPLPKDVVGASTQRCGGSLYPKMLWMPHGKWRYLGHEGVVPQGCKALRKQVRIAWSGVAKAGGVVAKMLEWCPRVLLGAKG